MASVGFMSGRRTRCENLFLMTEKRSCHLNLEKNLDSLEGRDGRLADGGRDAAGHEVQQEVVVHGEAASDLKIFLVRSAGATRFGIGLDRKGGSRLIKEGYALEVRDSSEGIC